MFSLSRQVLTLATLAATAALVGITAAGCSLVPRALGGGDGDPTRVTVVGTATYRERITLPPNALFEATLEDVSRGADAPATVLATSRIFPADELPPYRYSLSAARSELPATARLVVRARITVEGRLWFTNAQDYPVQVDRGGRQTIDVLLRAPETRPSALPR
jgi:putative lipoprotein